MKDEKDVQQLLAVVDSRKVIDVNKAPKQILNAVKIVLKNFPEIEELWLTGSYVKGTFRIKGMNPELKMFLVNVLGCKPTWSDVDFCSIPPIKTEIGDVHLIGHPDAQNEKTLVYKKGGET